MRQTGSARLFEKRSEESWVTNPDPSAGDGGEKPIALENRLLAEAVRIHEDALGFAADEPVADEFACAAGGNFEHRLAVRAEALTVSASLKTAFYQLRSGSRLVIGAGLVLAAIAGAAAATAVFGSDIDKPVNFFWVLGSLLGVHTLALLTWLALMIFTPRTATGGFLGAAVLAVSKQIDHWLHKESLHTAAAQATAIVYGSGALGRWTLSTITHVLWLAFLVGCLAMMLLTLSARQYSFAWETTILAESNYMALAGAIGKLPAAMGFPVPDPGQVAASRWTGAGQPAAETREAWAGLLVGSIVAYGLLPRGIVLLVSLAARRFGHGPLPAGYDAARFCPPPGSTDAAGAGPPASSIPRATGPTRRQTEPEPPKPYRPFARTVPPPSSAWRSSLPRRHGRPRSQA